MIDNILYRGLPPSLLFVVTALMQYFAVRAFA